MNPVMTHQRMRGYRQKSQILYGEFLKAYFRAKSDKTLQSAQLVEIARCKSELAHYIWLIAFFMLHNEQEYQNSLGKKYRAHNL